MSGTTVAPDYILAQNYTKSPRQVCPPRQKTWLPIENDPGLWPHSPSSGHFFDDERLSRRKTLDQIARSRDLW